MAIAPSDAQWPSGARTRSVALYALLGALSGLMATILIATEWFDVWVVLVGPGLFFGLVIGTALQRRDFDIYMKSEIHLALGPPFAKHVKEHVVCDYQTR